VRVGWDSGPIPARCSGRRKQEAVAACHRRTIEQRYVPGHPARRCWAWGEAGLCPTTSHRLTQSCYSLRKLDAGLSARPTLPHLGQFRRVLSPKPRRFHFLHEPFHTADLVSPRATVPLEQLMLGGNYLKDLKKREGVLLSGLRLSLRSAPTSSWPVLSSGSSSCGARGRKARTCRKTRRNTSSSSTSKTLCTVEASHRISRRSCRREYSSLWLPERPRRKDSVPPRGCDARRWSQGAAQPEPRQGEAQLDYLRNIADEIQARHDELRATGRGSIAAIGIIASDVFDKLLILRALRGKFPAHGFSLRSGCTLLGSARSRLREELDRRVALRVIPPA
jgi:hypothetical protein